VGGGGARVGRSRTFQKRTRGASTLVRGSCGLLRPACSVREMRALRSTPPQLDASGGFRTTRLSDLFHQDAAAVAAVARRAEEWVPALVVADLAAAAHVVEVPRVHMVSLLHIAALAGLRGWREVVLPAGRSQRARSRVQAAGPPSRGDRSPVACQCRRHLPPAARRQPLRHRTHSTGARIRPTTRPSLALGIRTLRHPCNTYSPECGRSVGTTAALRAACARPREAASHHGPV